MSHDYAKRNNKPAATPKRNNTRTTNKASTNSRWHLKSFVCGIAVALIAQWIFAFAQKSPQVESAISQAKQAVLAEPVQQKPKPDITFYEVLPEQKVKVNVTPTAEPKTLPYNSVLQAGSFRNKNEAEQQRAEVLLLGLPATVETGTNSSGTTWHRVIVGPFSSRSQLNNARNTLANNNMPSLTLKR